MKKAYIAIACVAAMGLVTSNADAQCNFDVPAKSKGVKSSMIRSFAGCGNSVTFGAPNTATMAGVPGCVPPFAHSSFLFGPKGACSVKTSQKVETPCSETGTPGSCANAGLSAKCKDITLSDGVTPISVADGTWKLRTLIRATLDDQLFGDQTVIDFSSALDMDDAKKGGFKGKGDSNGILEGLFGPGSSLPACSSLGILSVDIVDPSGSAFAVLGSATQ